MTRVILAIDPGKVNMGYSVIEYDDDTATINILEVGMVKHTIQDLKGYNIKPVVLAFNKEICTLIRKYKVTELTMERFVSRGLLGSLSEFICIMQGILAINTKIKIFNLVTAATWKNCFNKNYVLNDYYKEAKKLKIEPHEIDAVMLGLYFINKELFLRLVKKKSREALLIRIAKR